MDKDDKQLEALLRAGLTVLAMENFPTAEYPAQRLTTAERTIIEELPDHLYLPGISE